MRHHRLTFTAVVLSLWGWWQISFNFHLMISFHNCGQIDQISIYKWGKLLSKYHFEKTYLFYCRFQWKRDYMRFLHSKMPSYCFTTKLQLSQRSKNWLRISITRNPMSYMDIFKIKRLQSKRIISDLHCAHSNNSILRDEKHEFIKNYN